MSNNEIVVDENQFIVSKTDLEGRIIYGNDLFIKMSGYTEKELIGTTHNILRHRDKIIDNFTNMENASTELFGILDRMNQERLQIQK